MSTDNKHKTLNTSRLPNFYHISSKDSTSTYHTAFAELYLANPLTSYTYFFTPHATSYGILAKNKQHIPCK